MRKKTVTAIRVLELGIYLGFVIWSLEFAPLRGGGGFDDKSGNESRDKGRFE
jgi:hypothetical protein